VKGFVRWRTRAGRRRCATTSPCATGWTCGRGTWRTRPSPV